MSARVVVVEDAGHLLMLEHPQLVTQQLLMLIARAQRAVAEPCACAMVSAVPVPVMVLPERLSFPLGVMVTGTAFPAAS